MTATPIESGRCYRVTCRGRLPLTVMAAHGCDAINQVLEIYFHV